jgi:hypothetical protein
MNHSKKYRCKGILGEFLVDRIIAKIYRIISQRQIITSKTLLNLVNKCIKNFDLFK